MSDKLESMETNRNGVLLGIDIGSTTLSIVVADVESRSICRAYTLPNDSTMETGEADFSQQDADRIVAVLRGLLDRLRRVFPNIQAMGFTGQMHGVLCVDEAGHAVTPLYTWQDQRADRLADDCLTYCQQIQALTGWSVCSGYGLATLYYNKVNNLLPQSAKSFCTIMDYAAMQLTGTTRPVMHASNAASLGLFHLTETCFDGEAIAALGLSVLEVPEITDRYQILGMCQGIPVITAIGDNQASFFGSIRDEAASILVNYGTGSQVSVVTAQPYAPDGIELRPYIDGTYLLCGCALCGGKAYAVLERFFRKCSQALCGTTGAQYETMNALAERAYQAGSSLSVSTLFCGTRSEPGRRGSISQIDDQNLTPENLVLGTLQGMVDELADMYRSMGHSGASQLVASGNAVQKNPTLRALLADTFGMAVHLTAHNEEAALGAALYAGIGAGVISREEAKAFIQFK